MKDKHDVNALHTEYRFAFFLVFPTLIKFDKLMLKYLQTSGSPVQVG